jgi:ABC-type branched-subunit amino acid transport system ATPase component
MSNSLAVKGLAVGYSEPIVTDIDFSASEGDIVALVGVNGAGKSTILKSIMGSARVHAGVIELNGTDVTGRRSDLLAREGVAYVPQEHAVFSGLTVAENLRMGGYSLPRRLVAKRIEEQLARFPQLVPKQSSMAHVLSGGERRQLALARALMTEPTVILLDEPTSNLSADLANELLSGHVARLAQDGRVVVVVEQRVEMVLAAATRACLIGGGKMRMCGEAHEVLGVIREHGLLVTTVV